MKRVGLAFIAAAGIAAHPMFAQPSAIAGRVVADDTGEPIRNTRVALNAPGEQERSVVLSDQDGRFYLPAFPGRQHRRHQDRLRPQLRDRGCRWYPRSRFLQRSPTDTLGAFLVAGLPAGSYYAAAVAALPDDGEDAWQDPAFLDSLMPSASTVLIGEGQRASVNPRLAR